MNTSTKTDSQVSEIFAAFVGVFIVLPLQGWALQYVLDFWATNLRHQPIHVAYWACALVCLFPWVARVAVPAWILTLLFGYLAR